MADEKTEEKTEEKADSRRVYLEVPKGFMKLKHPINLAEEELKKLATDKGTEQVARSTFIQDVWCTDQYTRGEIRKMCIAYGDQPEMKYQIVFQATNNDRCKGHGKLARTESTEESKED